RANSQFALNVPTRGLPRETSNPPSPSFQIDKRSHRVLECILEEDESSCTEQSSSIQTVSEQPQIEPSASTSYDYSAPKYGRAASTNHSLAQDSYHHYHQLQPIQESDESDAYEHDDYNEVWYPSDQSLSCAEDGNGKRSSRTKKNSANQFVAYVPHMLMKGSNEGDDGGQPCWDEEMITVIVDDYPSSEEEESDEALFVKKKRALRKRQEEEEHEYDADRSDDEGGDYVMGVQVLESHVLLSTFLEMARE
ncbi:2688_t:CDS:2, partial [Acaulospora colombiana]